MVKKGKGGKKRPVAHKVATQLLKKDPDAHLYTLAYLYAEGTVVPDKDIPKLLSAFRLVVRQLGITDYRHSVTQGAIESLKEQLKKAKKKGKK